MSKDGRGTLRGGRAIDPGSLVSRGVGSVTDRRNRPLADRPIWPLAVGLLAWGLSTGGCDWRKPLPHRPDAGPPVQLVDTGAKGPDSTGTKKGTGPGSASPHTSLFLLDEHEPNDEAEQAQPIPSGRGVRGSLAPPTALGAGKGADDFYMVAASAATGNQLLGLTLTTGPLVDTQLDIYAPVEPRGANKKPTLLWHIDDRGPGQGERVTALAVRAGQVLLVRVRGALTPAKGPEPAGATTAAASLDYQLSVAQSAAPMGSEVEPNDTYEAACAADGSDLSGTLTSRGDEDFFSLRLADALYRRGQPAGDDGAPGSGARAAAGIKTDAILRVEVRSPGVMPALRIWVEPESSPAASTGGPDAGAVAEGKPAAASAVAFGKLRFLGDFVAGKGQGELRLRNLPLPRGSARAFVSVRAVGGSPVSGNKDGAGARGPTPDSRYSLRMTVEPPLEGAETEPNDECEQANVLPIAAHGSVAGGAGVAMEAQLAGFLWPGDVDCYRIPGKPDGAATTAAGAAASRTWTVKLAVPGVGADCDAIAEIVKGPTTESLPPPAAADPPSGTGKTLQLRARGDAFVRVLGRDRGCSQAPYLLSVSSAASAP